jgi:hypothetical protein
VAGGQVVVAHKRCFGRRENAFNSLHFLAVLVCKPAALD